MIHCSYPNVITERIATTLRFIGLQIAKDGCTCSVYSRLYWEVSDRSFAGAKLWAAYNLPSLLHHPEEAHQIWYILEGSILTTALTFSDPGFVPVVSITCYENSSKVYHSIHFPLSNYSPAVYIICTSLFEVYNACFECPLSFPPVLEIFLWSALEAFFESRGSEQETTSSGLACRNTAFAPM